MSSERIIAIEAGDALMADVFRLRFEVFVHEQGVAPELELDAEDDTAIHLAAIRDGEVVGTLRLLQHDGTAKIGRVAVRAALRKSGIGRRLMDHGAAIALRKGFAEILLHAQVTVAEFYWRLGYVAEGDVFDEAGIPHIAMRKKLR
jgi:predicted GNAT family N-acyltransferase